MIDFSSYKKIADAAVVAVIKTTEGVPDAFRDILLYAVEDGGKRVRPTLCMLAAEFAESVSDAKCFDKSGEESAGETLKGMFEACGVSPKSTVGRVLPYAVAVELIHSYSLVHDDLPSMDNDDMRRGKPTVHKRYGEANAVLAGDALLNLAYETLAEAGKSASGGEDLPYVESGRRAAAYIADCAGASGMIKGQIFDIELAKIAASEEAERRVKISLLTEEHILETYRLKTSKLLMAGAVSGAVAVGACEDAVKDVESYAENLGLAFQLIDDIIDAGQCQCQCQCQVQGAAKSAVQGWLACGGQKDAPEISFAGVFGIERTRELARQHTKKAISALEKYGANAAPLVEYAKLLLGREY